MTRYKFRPHHFLCTVGFQGKGYSKAFVENYQKIAQVLQSPEGDQVQIEVVDRTDSICDPCPSKIGAKCESQEKIEKLDNEHAQALRIQEGDVLTWGEAKKRIKENITVNRFHQICEGCQWKALGVCESSLKKLSLTLVFIVATLLGAPESSWAKDTTTQVQAVIQKQIKKVTGKKKFQKATKAFNALREGKITQASKFLKQIKNHSEVKDYYRWMSAEVETIYANRHLKRQKSVPAIKKSQSAINHLLRIQYEMPNSPLIKEVPQQIAYNEFLMGKANVRRFFYNPALSVFERGFARMSQIGRLTQVPMSTIEAFAESCRRKKTKNCLDWAEILMDRFPERSLEYKVLERKLSKWIKSDTRSRRYKTKIRSYRAPAKDQHHFDEAFEKILSGNEEGSIEKLEELLKLYPKTKEGRRARFWIGKLKKEEGEKKEAQEIFEKLAAESPLDFYCILAANELKKWAGTYLENTTLTIDGSIDRLGPVDRFRMNRILGWLGQGNVSLATKELRKISGSTRMSNEFIRYLIGINNKAGNYVSSSRMMGLLLRRRGESARTVWGMKQFFPQSEWLWKNIRQISKKHKTDPLLILSLIKQESGFNYEARSRSGAMGLMQLMPFTATDVDSQVTQTEIFDPQKNMALGTEYLAGLLRRFDQNIAYALAAYNAGPGRVRRWKREFKLPDSMTWDQTLEFIERIPYNETRIYVSSILRNYYWYEYLYHQKKRTDFPFVLKK